MAARRPGEIRGSSGTRVCPSGTPRADIDGEVAKTLRLPPSLWGPRMSQTNNLPIHTRRALAKLGQTGDRRRMESQANASLFRLADFGSRPPAQAASRPRLLRSNLDAGSLFMTIVSKSGKDNTYKFVLGKVLLDYCNGQRPRIPGDTSIPYDYLAGEFSEALLAPEV